MYPLLSMLFVLAFVGPLSVQAASCSDKTGGKCEATDFTLKTCTNNVCDCMAGYQPIPSGCAMKLGKPRVIFQGDRTGEVIEKGQVTLLCSVTGPSYERPEDVEELFYEWKKDDQVQTAVKMNNYTFTADSEADVGKFSCKVKLHADQDSAIDSPESDAVTIVFLTTGNTTHSQPNITNVPENAASGSSFTPTCTNIPFGATYEFEVGNSRQGPQISFTNNTSIKCVMSNTRGVIFTNPNSAAATTGEVADKIDSVKLEVDGAMTASSYVFNTAQTAPTIKCVTTPTHDLMTVSPKTISYTIKDSMEDASVNTPEYTPAQSLGEHKITCNATYTNKEPVGSPELIVTFSEDYIKTPMLIASGTHLPMGARLVLTCGESQDNVNYLWYKEDSLIVLQRDRIIQFDNFTEAEAGKYYCKAFKDNYEVMSNNVTVEKSDTIEKPMIERVDDATNFGEKGDYQLMCKTSSATSGMSFEWKKNDAVVTDDVDGSHYKITAAAADKHNGNYTCKASFDGKHSEVSDMFEVKVTDAGKPCTAASGTTDAVCVGDEYTRKCGDGQRCECKKNYIKHGSVCKSHSPALISSAILVIAAVIFSRLF